MVWRKSGESHAVTRRSGSAAFRFIAISSAAVIFGNVTCWVVEQQPFSGLGSSRVLRQCAQESSPLGGRPVPEARRRVRRAERTLRWSTPVEVEDDLWMPPLDLSDKGSDVLKGEGILPLFPLGSLQYLPYTEQKLNIFEPRYRELYDHILFSGSRRFAVCAVDAEGRFSRDAVVFYLKDLKEVSEATGDQVKYIVDHYVMGRVRIERVLNPANWADRATYLRVQTTPLEDTDTDQDYEPLEVEVVEKLNQLIKAHGELSAKDDRTVIRFSPDIAENLNASRDESKGLWQLAEQWIEYLQARIKEENHNLGEDMKKVIQTYINGNLDALALKDEKKSLSFEDLPSSVRVELHQLQQEHYKDKVLQLSRDTTALSLRMVHSTSHGERLRMLSEAYEKEQTRLSARKVLVEALRSKPSER